MIEFFTEAYSARTHPDDDVNRWSLYKIRRELFFIVLILFAVPKCALASRAGGGPISGIRQFIVGFTSPEFKAIQTEKKSIKKFEGF